MSWAIHNMQFAESLFEEPKKEKTMKKNKKIYLPKELIMDKPIKQKSKLYKPMKCSTKLKEYKPITKIRYRLIKEKPLMNRDWVYGAQQVKEVELTEDDYGLILDALYEQAALQESCVMLSGKVVKIRSTYSEECREVAKKFEKIFGGK